MLEKLTESAQTAVGKAIRFAVDAGHPDVDVADCLVGLSTADGIAAEVLAQFGISAGLSQRVREARPAVPLEDQVPAFDGEARSAVVEAVRLAAEVGHDAVDTGHLLLALVFPEDGSGRRVLGGFGVDAEAVRDAVTARRPAGEKLSFEGPAAGPRKAFIGWDQVWADAPERLPGRAAAVRSVLTVCGFFVLFSAALLDAASPHRRTLLALYLLCVPAIIMPIRAAIRPSRLDLHVRSMRTVPGGKLPAPAPLADLANRRYGRMEVRLLIEDRLVKSRMMRDHKRAWVIISAAHIANPDVRRFVTLHETAHLLRNDTLRYELTWVLATTLAGGAIVSSSSPGLAAGFAAAIALQLIGRWPAELACDTLATRWAGPNAMTQWATQTRRLRALPANRTPSRRLRRVLFGWLTHPPMPMRERLSGP